MESLKKEKRDKNFVNKYLFFLNNRAFALPFFPLPAVSGMMGEYFAPDEFFVHVHIYFGGRDAFVTEHLLYGSQIGSPFQQMCCKRVPQRVRADLFPDAAAFALLAYDMENHGSCQPPAPPVEKQDVFVSFFYGQPPPILQVQAYFVQGGLGNGNQPLFVSFSLDDDKFFFRIELRESEIDQFRYPQSRSVHHFDNGFVALAFGQREVKGGEQPFDFLYGKYFGQFQSQLGAFQPGVGLRMGSVVTSSRLVTFTVALFSTLPLGVAFLFTLTFSSTVPVVL